MCKFFLQNSFLEENYSSNTILGLLCNFTEKSKNDLNFFFYKKKIITTILKNRTVYFGQIFSLF